MTHADFLGLFQKGIQNVEQFRQLDNVALESQNLRDAICNSLQYAVSAFDTSQKGIEAMAGMHVVGLIERYLVISENALLDLKREGTPRIGIVDLVVEAHLAILLGKIELSKRMMILTQDTFRLRFFPLTIFWGEYARAFCCLLSSTPYIPLAIRTKGYESNWNPYLLLISDLTNGKNIAGSLSLVGNSFRHRNADKRYIDWLMIDGDGRHPVRWDFRLAAIMCNKISKSA